MIGHLLLRLVGELGQRQLNAPPFVGISALAF
jgi:hypothetical protein